MICHYCEIFQTGCKESWINKDEKNIINKICPVTKKIVSPNTPYCKNIIVSDMFFCDKYHQHVSLRACIKRYTEKKETCTRCRQGKAICNFMRGRQIGIPKEFTKSGLRKVTL